MLALKSLWHTLLKQAQPLEGVDLSDLRRVLPSYSKDFESMAMYLKRQGLPACDEATFTHDNYFETFKTFADNSLQKISGLVFFDPPVVKGLWDRHLENNRWIIADIRQKKSPHTETVSYIFRQKPQLLHAQKNYPPYKDTVSFFKNTAQSYGVFSQSFEDDHYQNRWRHFEPDRGKKTTKMLNSIETRFDSEHGLFHLFKTTPLGLEARIFRTKDLPSELKPWIVEEPMHHHLGLQDDWQILNEQLNKYAYQNN